MENYTYEGMKSSAPWYSQRETIEKVIIENGVTNIGEYAFVGCSHITSISIPNSVTSIGERAFYCCSCLTSITIPSSVVNIGRWVFVGCIDLTSIIVDKDNKVYDSRNDCNAIIYTSTNELIFGSRNTIIPNSVSSIGKYAFEGCSELISITIPNSVTSIGNYAFEDCSDLTSITISNSVTSIGNGVFYNCSNLTSITIPNSVTSIGNYAFDGCVGLTSITIPNSLTSIGRGVFYNCSNLASIIIPNSVTSIGERAFENCKNLKKVFNNSSLVLTKKSSNNGYIAYYADIIYNNVSIDDNFIIYEDNKGHLYVCDYLGSDKSITIPNGIYGIAEYAFYGCSDLSSVTISDNVVSIDSHAFEGCKLQTLIIGTDVTYISSDIFYASSKPTKTIWLPNTPPSGCEYASGSINYVMNENFSNIPNTKLYKQLSSLFEVDGIRYVPVSLSERTCNAIDCICYETIGNIKINDLVSYKGIEMKVLDVNPYTCYGNEFVKTLYINNNGRIDNHAFEGCKNITNVLFGNKVTSIGDYAFSGCTSIKEIEITNPITSIATYGFSGCTALQELTIGNGLTSIGDYCFSGCKSLTNVKFEESPATIGAYAFVNCSSLSEISIPETTTSVGDYAFSGCNSLADITIEDRAARISLGSNGSSPLFTDCPINSVYLGGKLSYSTSNSSGYSPFYHNENLQSVVIANTEEEIYDNEFYGCTNLKSVKIGDGVKNIGNWAFSGCTSLESFSFGKSIQSIGKQVFFDCINMKSLTSYAATAPECGSQALDDIDKVSCVLTVPYSCLASYQNAAQWKEFFFIQESEPDAQTIADKAASDAVIAKIIAIGKVEYTETCKDKIDDASTAYDALTDTQKALVSNLEVLTTAKQTYETLKAAAEKLAADKAKADDVVAKISAIGKVKYTDACKKKIDNASNAYNALTDDQKALVSNIDVLTTAKQTYETLKAAAEKLAADKAKADAVVAKIAAIGKVKYTDACKKKIDNASTAYEALTDDQKALVSNLEVLTTAKQTYESLKIAAEKLAADKVKADAVIVKISAIGKVKYTDACKKKIDNASTAYEALTDDQKALVTNLDVLTMAKQTYEDLKAAAEKLAADKAAADVVIAKITAIGNVEYTDVCKDKIDDASNAYDALTDDQKTLVTNLEVLTTARQTYNTLKAAADELMAYKAAFENYKSELKAIIEALGKEDDSDAVKDIINKAISDIDALEYDVAISLDDNKAKVLSLVNSVDKAVENQRAEDQKTNGIEELELAEKVNIYDLNGKKISHFMLKSGLYIKNGKKVVVK